MNVIVIMEVVIRLVLMKLDLSIVNVLLVINWMMMDRDVQVKYSTLTVACGSIQPLSVIILSYSLYIYLSLSLTLSVSLSLSLSLCLSASLCLSLPVTLSLQMSMSVIITMEDVLILVIMRLVVTSVHATQDMI